MQSSLNGITVLGLQNGTTYLPIVSSAPSIPTSGTPLRTNFTPGTPFPVSLQQFSVD